MKTNTILQGEALEQLKTLPEKSINMCLTSPPYWALRDYGVDKQLGLEATFDEYINKLCNIFDEVKRVLRDDGTCWVVIGDTYWGTGGGQKDTGKHSYNPKTMAVNKKPKWNGKNINANLKLRKRFCCECGKEFEALSHQYFCGSACSGVDNTSRTIKGLLQDKCLISIPFRFVIEMINRGWILRNTIIWHKPNCMPSSVKDRFTADFEYIFFFSKKKKYYFEQQTEPSISKESYEGRKPRGKGTMATVDLKNYQFAGSIGEDGILKNKGKKYPNKNKRTVWRICPKGFKEAHFAVFPEELCETPLKAGCSIGGIVLDPFFGAGTTGLVALKQCKKFIGIELNPEYIEIANKRLKPYLEQSKITI